MQLFLLMILYPATLLNSLISSESILLSLEVSMYKMISLATNTTTSQQYTVLYFSIYLAFTKCPFLPYTIMLLFMVLSLQMEECPLAFLVKQFDW